MPVAAYRHRRSVPTTRDVTETGRIPWSCDDV
jgi:hypothetical protein